MTIENLTLVLTAVALLAASVERGIELFRPVIEKLSTSWQHVVKIGGAILIGFGLAALLRVDVLAMLGVSFYPVAGYLLAGVLASAGASPWHAVLEWLKQTK
jgi:hypothetical protein